MLADFFVEFGGDGVAAVVFLVVAVAQGDGTSLLGADGEDINADAFLVGFLRSLDGSVFMVFCIGDENEGFAHVGLVAIERIGSHPLAAGILIGTGLHHHVAVFIGSLVGVEVVNIEHRVAVLVVTSPLVGPERAERLAFHDALGVAVGGDTTNHWVALVNVVDAIGRVGQFLHRVLVVREVQRGLPLEVLGLHGDGVDGELNTLVLDVAHVGADPVQRIDVGRYGVAPDQVGGLLVVILDATVDAAAEESEVKTDVEHTRTLPLQFWVGVVLGLNAVHGIRSTIGEDVLERVGVQAISGNSVVGTEAHGITAHTVTHAEFQLVEQRLVLHEGFFGDVPCSRNRGEGTPAVLLAEDGRTVAADAGLQHVARVVAIVHTSVERDVANGLLRVACHVGDAVDVVGIAQVPE